MAELPTAILGRTGLEVTTLAYGAMELRGPGPMGGRQLDPGHVDRLLNQVLDSGINFIDTSPDYGDSEEHIGRALSARRDEFFLASKCGCQVGGGPSAVGPMAHVFTRENVRAGVEQSLRRMRTDYLDVVQFHGSPSPAVLEENGAVAELEALRDEGKIRFIGMSGTLPDLPGQIGMGVFDEFQIPYSALERDHEALIAEAAAAGAGVVVRGGVARGTPVATEETFTSVPEFIRPMLEGQRDTFERAGIEEILGGMSRMEFMLRFTLSHPGMTTTIVGTANPEHLAANVAAAAKGPLPGELYEAAKRLLDQAGPPPTLAMPPMPPGATPPGAPPA